MSVECRLSLRFRFFVAAVLLYYYCSHGGIVGCWWIGFLLYSVVLLYDGTRIRGDVVILALLLLLL